MQSGLSNCSSEFDRRFVGELAFHRSTLIGNFWIKALSAVV
jgi:hypothetical protein